MARGCRRTGVKVEGANPAERLLTRYLEYLSKLACTETDVQFTMWKARTSEPGKMKTKFSDITTLPMSNPGCCSVWVEDLRRAGVSMRQCVLMYMP